MTYQKGQSGNPDGRPKGRPDRRLLYRQYVEPDMPALLRKAVEIARNGDKLMLRCIFDRFMPIFSKDDLLPEDIKLIKGALFDQANQVTDLINERDISPIEGNNLLTGIEKKAAIKYKEDLEKELEDLKKEFKSFKDKFGK